MVGITATPGYMSRLSASMGPMTSRRKRRRCAGLFRRRLEFDLTPGSAMAAMSSWRISSALWPGNMRQLTLAVARCGRALGAWPPCDLRGHAVGAQDGVGRRILLEPLDGRRIAASSPPRSCRRLFRRLRSRRTSRNSARGVVELDLELVRFDLVERVRQLIDRVVGRGAR